MLRDGNSNYMVTTQKNYILRITIGLVQLEELVTDYLFYTSSKVRVLEICYEKTFLTEEKQILSQRQTIAEVSISLIDGNFRYRRGCVVCYQWVSITFLLLIAFLMCYLSSVCLAVPYKFPWS